MSASPHGHPAPGRTRYELLLVVAVLAIAAWLALPALSRSRTAARRAACLANLSAIGQGLQSYVAGNGNRWPHVAKLPSVEYHQPPWLGLPVVLKNHVDSKDRFRCPADRRALAEGSPLRQRFDADTTYFETEGTSYEWALQEMNAGQPVGRDALGRMGGKGGAGVADQPVLWDFEPFHRSDDEEAGSFNVLYADFRARSERSTLKISP